MRIFKYTLVATEVQKIAIPGKILSVESQNGQIVVYSLVDNNEPILYEFRIHGTGHLIADIDGFEFLGTIKMANDTLIFHVFYKNEVMK